MPFASGVLPYQPIIFVVYLAILDHLSLLGYLDTLIQQDHESPNSVLRLTPYYFPSRETALVHIML